MILVEWFCAELLLYSTTSGALISIWYRLIIGCLIYDISCLSYCIMMNRTCWNLDPFLSIGTTLSISIQKGFFEMLVNIDAACGKVQSTVVTDIMSFLCIGDFIPCFRNNDSFIMSDFIVVNGSEFLLPIMNMCHFLLCRSFCFTCRRRGLSPNKVLNNCLDINFLWLIYYILFFYLFTKMANLQPHDCRLADFQKQYHPFSFSNKPAVFFK